MATGLEEKEVPKPRKAVVTVSGGLDSAVALALALDKGREVIALFVDYGQGNPQEYEMHKKLVLYYNERGHRVHSATSEIVLPQMLNFDKNKGYIPCRNAMLLSLAFSVAENEGCQEVWNGIHHGSRSHSFPDATWEFIQSFELMMTLGSDAGSKGKRIRLISPLLSYAKTGVVNTGFNYNVPFHLTWSCWKSSEKPCGKCASCEGRAEAFAEAKLTDPQTC